MSQNKFFPVERSRIILYGISHVSQINPFSVEKHGILKSYTLGTPVPTYGELATPPHPKGVGWPILHAPLLFRFPDNAGYPWARGVLVRILKEIREANFRTDEKRGNPHSSSVKRNRA